MVITDSFQIKINANGLKKCLAGFWLLLICCYGIKGYAVFDCDQYQHQEFKDLCHKFGQEITVHSHITGSLNQWKRQIGNKPGLHIIPGRQYILTETLIFGDQQGVLPAPSEAEGLAINAIQLAFAHGFANGNSAVLELGAGSKAGGFIIDVDEQAIGNQYLPEFSIVSLAETKNVELVLSYFAVPIMASLGSLVDIKQQDNTGGDSSDAAPVLNRVLLSSGSSDAGIKVKLHSGRGVKINNCLLETSSMNNAIQLGQGTVELMNSEVYLKGNCWVCGSTLVTDGSRIIITGSFFHSDGAGNVVRENWDDSAEQTTGWVLGNLFTFGLSLLADNLSNSGLIVGDNYVAAPERADDINGWQEFQGYQGLLGIARLPPCNSTVYELDNSPEVYQRPVSFSHSGFQQKKLAATSGFSCSQQCPKLMHWPPYLTAATFGLNLLAYTVLPVLACIYGRKHRRTSGYQTLN